MRVYEVVYIFTPSLDEHAISERLDRFHEILTGADGAEVMEVDHWGSRQLAYPIGNQQIGHYAVAHVRSDPSALTEFERVLKLEPDLLRFLVVVNEGEPTSGSSIMSDRPEGIGGRSEEDDEEDDEAESDGDDDEDDEDSEDSDSDGSPPEFSGGTGRRRRVEGPSIELLNYKDVATLSRFMTEEGKILPKRTTKVTAAFQRKLGRAVKRARYVGLVPYVRSQEF